MGRLVQNHSTNINGLIKWLSKMSKSQEIKTITPGCLSKANNTKEKLSLKISRKTTVGYKLIARKGKIVQEVFIVTELEEDRVDELIVNSNPYAYQKKKRY